jgi:iron complex outermembrane recepter protein
VGPGNVPIAITSNAANSRVYGFEGDVRYKLVSDLNVNASPAYLHARYISFSNAPANILCFTSSTACGGNYGVAPPVVINTSGFVMLRAPEWASSVGVRYTMAVARGRLALSSNL